jgi:phosphoribosylanthranilate isomerase
VIRRTRIKLCGMTRAEDLALAVALGVDAVGLIMVPRSPRCLSLPQARALRGALPPLVASVLLVMDTPPSQVCEFASVVRPTLLQFHGAECEADCRSAGLPYLKALPMGEGGTDAEAAMAGYPSAAGFVLDGHPPGATGGAGERFDWSRWPQQARRPLLLAGGLTPDNVFDAVYRLRPFAVDVSSGVESAPGVKCAQKMARFVSEVARADAAAAAEPFSPHKIA